MASTPLYPAENISSVPAVRTLVSTVKDVISQEWQRDWRATGKIKWWFCGGEGGSRRGIRLSHCWFFTSIRQVKEGLIFPSLMKASTSWGLSQGAQWIGSGSWSAPVQDVVLWTWISDMGVYLPLRNSCNVSQKAAQLTVCHIFREERFYMYLFFFFLDPILLHV